MSNELYLKYDFDVPPEAPLIEIQQSPRHKISTPRASAVRPSTPPPESPRSVTPPVPQLDAISPARTATDNPSYIYPSEDAASSRMPTEQRHWHSDPLRDAADTSPKKPSGPWDKFQRFTAGIAGIMPAKLSGRRNSQDEKEDIHGVAVELLKLAFAVCASTPAEVQLCAGAATALDRLALKRVLELAILSGLLGPNTEGFFEHIEAFLKGANAKPKPSESSKCSHFTGEKRNSSGSGSGSRVGMDEGMPDRLDHALDRREHFRQRGRSRTNMSEFSNVSHISVRSKETDFSATSFLDFNGKQNKGPHSFFDYLDARRPSSQLQDIGQSCLPIVMEIDMPDLPTLPESRDRSQKVHFEDCASEGGETYHSMCDVVMVGENGARREPVKAEIMSLGNKGDGPTQMKIAFKSECLRTQNEWQRHLLLQQRSLVDAMTTKLESAEEEIQMRNEVIAEEKELLSSFGKIVTREIDLTDKSLTMEVFVVEKDVELSREIEELCDILEFPCSTFRSLTLAADGLKSSQNIVQEFQRRHLLARSSTTKSVLTVVDEHPKSRPQSKAKNHPTLRHMETREILTLIGETGSSENTSQTTPHSPRYRKSATGKSELGVGKWRSEGERSFTRSGTSKSSLSRISDGLLSHHTCSSGFSSSSAEPKYCRIIFVGFEWLQRDLPTEWVEGDSPMYIVLTSKEDKFEQVGRQLLAENKAEMLERLAGRGISDYVLQPLSLDGLRRLANAAMCKSFGHEYLLTKVLGRGAYGVVYRAKRLKDGKVFALKEINTRHMTKSAQAELEAETELLKHLGWPTLVEMVDAWYVHKLRYLLMPLLDRGTIDDRIVACQDSSAPLPFVEIAEWYAQIMHGIVYLHHHGVIHRDIKPSNILLATEGVLQIGDLGNALTVPGQGPHPCKRLFVAGSTCTPCYASPESVTQECILFASDLWSVGVSLYEMLTLQNLFPPKSGPAELGELIEKFDLDGSFFFRDQKNLGSSALATLRNCPHSSSNSTAFAEVSDDVKHLLRHDPLKRPSAATLAARTQIQQPLWNVLSAHLPEPEEHFALFEVLIAESKDAEQGAPPNADCAYPPVGGSSQKKSKARRNSLSTALARREPQAARS